MHPWSVSGFALRWSLCLGLVSGGIAFTGRAPAQEYVPFISFTNTWRYNQAGQNLGTNWVAPDYDDTADPWQSGPALLGIESPLGGNYNAAVIIPNIIPTPLSLSSAGGTNGTNITFYFRTKFTSSLTNMTGVELWATNLVDDGCVIYLNGVRAGHVRLTNANPGYVTLANSGPPSEGQFDPVRLPEFLLAPGENSLAVEVHQTAINSTDIAFAMRLLAIVSTPLVLTSQPPSTVSVYDGNSLTLSVGVAGGPAFFQWQRNGTNLPGATSANLTVPIAAASHGGTYRCLVTNSVSIVTSIGTIVSVVADLTGPRALEARVVETGATNIIQTTFDEPMMNAAASPNVNLNNYRIVVSGTTDQFVSVTNVQISGPSILLRVNAASNWVIGGNCYLVLNNLVDARTNVIAPNTVVPISWPRRLELLAPDAIWTFHAAAFFDATIYAEDWTAPDYVEGIWWAVGPGLFYGGSGNLPQCLGPAQTVVGFQPEPILFRTTFQWPADLGSNAQATITRAVDDGLILYLNGQEIQRINIAMPFNALTRSSTNVPTAACQSNAVALANLRPGTNWLAAAVVQSSAGTDADVVFGLRLSALVNVPGHVPDNPSPILAVSRLGTNARLAWAGYGYTLESTTNLNLGSASYPSGPWIPVVNLSNPYTNGLFGRERYFRLKK